MENFSWTSEQGAKVLIEHLQDGIFVIENGMIIYANQKLSSMTGYPMSSIIGRKFTDMIAEQDKPLVIERYLARLSGEQVPEQYEMHLIAADGRMLCCAVNICLLQDRDGNALTIGSVRDITRQEEERMQLKASQLELQAIFDNLPDVFYRTDMQGIITMISPSCFEVLGYRQESMIGKPLANFYETPEDRQRVVHAILDGGGRATSVEAALRHKNGSTVWISTNAAIRLGTDGRPCYIEGVARDITQRKTLEEKLTELSQTDPLTGVYNRRHFLNKAGELFSIMHRYHRPATLLLMDLDHFKRINDQHGHEAGDRVLLEFTRLCKAEIREQDIFGRLGGEEFGLLLPETEIEQACVVAERIRAVVESRQVHAGAWMIPVTVSIGLAEWLPDEQMLGEVMYRADSAMYRAKDEGRNRIATA